ncbi:hypothetical protein [Roseateles oligotrophus]|uniref:Glycosyltransferase RgtA/B/C/D-like domain-containing protein n=1 Tax=Roseateles oligotrophus TaxID=1769250 RepID=A0ABT2YMQ1_9BURK|nr:hypothetical protein [Roseateles oligotrophus]MCV2371344.1 hypothetical protein [Roseateles oligotrophus]
MRYLLKQPSGGGNPAWPGVIAMLCLALLSVAMLARLEFGRWSQDAIQVDELFFASCAARGLAEHQLPVAGCHDNKGPMIYLVHQLVQLASSTYDLSAIKLAAYLNVALLAAAVAWLAYLLSGALAATAAAALLLSALASDASHLALKTELLGGLFLLLALITLLARPGRRPSWTLLTAGALLGLATLTRQTYGFSLPALLLGIYLPLRSVKPAGFNRLFVLDSLMLIAGLLTPFCLFLLLFYLRGQELEFLANLFIYPAVRGVPDATPFAKTLQWQLGGVLSVLAGKPGLCTLFAIQSASVLGANYKTHAAALRQSQSHVQRQLALFFCTLSMLLVIFISPVFYGYHILPVELLMAVLAGIGLAELSTALLNAGPRNGKALLSIALITPSLLMAVSTWMNHGGTRNKREASAVNAILKGESRGEHAYVVGMWPSFYVKNGLIPASNLMFPWALAGAPPSGMYGPPPPGTRRAAMLNWAHGKMEAALLEDFRRSPPRFIAVINSMARSAGSKRITDVIIINDYLLEHCTFRQEIIGDHEFTGELYRCRIGNGPDSLPEKVSQAQ